MAVPPPSSHGNVSSRVATGTAWIIATRLGVRAIGFINMLIIARILVPEDFGLVALGVIAMQLLQNLTDVGIAQAMIKFRTTNRKDLETLFTLSVLRGGISTFLLVGFAFLAPAIYNDPRVFWVFIGIALYPLFLGFQNPRFFEFERNLDYTREFKLSLLTKLAEVGVALSVALIFRSYLALIMGLVTGGLVRLVLSYVMIPWRPSFSLTSFRKVFAFTGWVTGVSFIAAMNNKFDTLILGKIIGTVGTGNYYLGEQLAELPTREAGEPVARAIYPGLSSVQDDYEAMRQIYLQAVAAIAATALPAALGLAFVGYDAVHLLLGEKWYGTVPVIQLLTVALGFQTIMLPTQGFAMAAGRTQLVFWREVIYFIIRIPIFIWAGLTYGFMGAVWVNTIMGFFHLLLNLILYQNISGKPFWQPLYTAHRSLIAVAAMAVYFLLIRPITSIGELPMLVRFITDIGLGAGLFIITQLSLWWLEGQPKGIEQTITKWIVSMTTPPADKTSLKG
ncbi:MAG: lipopolysaccharide biosynthesis protein [bacterium]